MIVKFKDNKLPTFNLSIEEAIKEYLEFNKGEPDDEYESSYDRDLDIQAYTNFNDGLEKGFREGISFIINNIELIINKR